jgi:hypothetical protein
MLNDTVQKTREHVKKNKKEYVIGGVCFAAGSLLTYFLARPSIGTLNVYNIYRGKQSDSDNALGIDAKKYH